MKTTPLTGPQLKMLRRAVYNAGVIEHVGRRWRVVSSLLARGLAEKAEPEWHPYTRITDAGRAAVAAADAQP